MKIDIDQYSHFSFDLWMTLIKSDPGFKKARNTLLKEFFCIEHSLEDIAEVIRHYDLLANGISEITETHFDAYQIYVLALKRLGVTMTGLNRNQLDIFQSEVDLLFMQYKPTLIDSDIADLFVEIQSRGKTISLLSNTAFIRGSVLRNVLQFYGLSHFFQFQLYSDEIRVSKPSNEAYDLCYSLATVGRTLAKHDIVHIGDNKYADYEGALNYGFKAILI